MTIQSDLILRADLGFGKGNIMAPLIDIRLVFLLKERGRSFSLHGKSAFPRLIKLKRLERR
jgi:hypothetical protein